MQIKQTKNYSMFKLDPLNRDVLPDRLEKVKIAIKRRNLTQDNPILINHKGVILSGQARFLACKELGLPVYYFVAGNTTLDDIPVVDATQTKWTMMDFVKHYGRQGKKDYQTLQRFLDEFKMPLSSAIILAGRGGARGSHNLIRSGDFKFKMDRYEEACKIARQLLDLKPYCDFYFASRFVGAFRNVSRHPKYKHRVMMEKIKYLSRKLTNQADTESFRSMLSEIYNYKSRTPVRFDIVEQEE